MTKTSRAARVGGTVAAVLLVAAVVSMVRGPADTDGSSPEAASCDVTIPSGTVPAGSRATSGWHGRKRVRVTLPPDGRLVVTTAQPPPPGTYPGSIDSDGSMSAKFLWWFSRTTGRRISITGTVDERSQSYVLARGRKRLPHYWPSRLRFPGEGCWHVTGRAGRAKLEFVIEVSAAEG